MLLVLARPEEEGVGFIDPRVSARPLVQALRVLGDRAELTLLPDGSYGGLERALSSARDAGRPFTVVHFDGHGVYRQRRPGDPAGVAGLGSLCFEKAEEIAAEVRAAARECARLMTPFGLAAQPWKIWDILHDIEQVAGDPAAAAAARARALALYRAYRADGGEPMYPLSRLIAQVAAQASHPDHGPAAALSALPPESAFDPSLLPIRQALESWLRGDPAPARALAGAPDTDYDAAVELSLLLDGPPPRQG